MVYMDLFLLLKRNIDYNNLHYFGNINIDRLQTNKVCLENKIIIGVPLVGLLLGWRLLYQTSQGLPLTK